MTHRRDVAFYGRKNLSPASQFAATLNAIVPTKKPMIHAGTMPTSKFSIATKQPVNPEDIAAAPAIHTDNELSSLRFSGPWTLRKSVNIL